MDLLVETVPKKQRKPVRPKLTPLVSAPLSAAGPTFLGCQSCELYKHCKTPFLRPYIPQGWTGKLLLVGEAPGQDEDENSLRPFTGRAGQLLRRLWRAAGYSDRDVALVNSVRCRPRKNATPSMSQVRACHPYVLFTIEKARPQILIGLGGTALRSFLNKGNVAVSDWRGRRIDIAGISGWILRWGRECKHKLAWDQRVSTAGPREAALTTSRDFGGIPAPLGWEYISGAQSESASEVPTRTASHQSASRRDAEGPIAVLNRQILASTSWSEATEVECVACQQEAPQNREASESSAENWGTYFLVKPQAWISFHPAAILHGATELEQYILDDLRRHTLPVLALPADGSPTGNTVAVDTEWDTGGRLLCVSVASPTTASVAAVEAVHFKESVEVPLANATRLAGHSVAGEVEVLVENNLPCKEAWAQGIDTYDSLLLARMADENQPSYALDDLLYGQYNAPGNWKDETNRLLAKVPDMGAVPAELRERRCRLDAWASAVLAVRDVAKSPPGLVRFTHQVASTLSRITLAGAFVDHEVFESLKRDLERERTLALDRLTKVALSAGMTDFSPTNDGHIRTLLYEKLALPVQDFTVKEHLPAVDKANLSQLDHEAVRALLAYNKADKLYGTNVVGVQSLFRSHGPRGDGVSLSFLPFHINPLAARTARRASNNPNSQNWSKRVRGIVTSRYPNGTIGDHDYSKLEPIILAWMAPDEVLMHAFTKGGGYRYFARSMWGFDCGDDSPEYRATKSIILGVHYNMQTPKMAWQLWLLGVKFSPDYDAHEAETGRLRGKYLSLVPGVVAYMGRQEDLLLSTQISVSPAGRVRHLPGGDDPGGRGWGHLLNQAINFPIQSLASDITGSALVDIEREILRLHGMSYLDYLRLLQEARRKVLTLGPEGVIMGEWWHNMPLLFNEVHDDLVYDIPHDQGPMMEELVVETMRAVPSFRKLVPSFTAPLTVGVKRAPHWGG